MVFTGDVLRGSSGEHALQILEGKHEATTALRKEDQDECGLMTSISGHR